MKHRIYKRYKRGRKKGGQHYHVGRKSYSSLPPGTYWHGSPSGNLKGGRTGLHVGTKKAAREALEARIGIPASGKGWKGDKEYKDTLLAGKKTLMKIDPRGFNQTGFNVNVPEKDFYPIDMTAKQRSELKYSDGSEMPLTVIPRVEPFIIQGKMTNTPYSPHEDTKANAYMAAQKRRGTARKGYFYKNISEDEGSISAVVPSGDHLDPLYPTEEKRFKIFREMFK